MRKRWRDLLIFVCLTCVVTAVGSLLITPTYESSTTILPRQSSRGNLLSMLSGGLSTLGGMAGGMPMPLSLPGGGGNTPLDLRGLLDSRAVTEQVIRAVELDRKFPEIVRRDDLIKKLRTMRDIKSPDLKDPFITITAHADDPVLAADIANNYVQQLDSLLQKINYNQGRKSRRFIEARLARVKLNLETAARNLTSFQKANQSLYLPEEVAETMKQLSQLQAQQMAARVQSREAEAELQASLTQVSSLSGTLDPQALTLLSTRSQALQARQRALDTTMKRYQQQLSTLPDKTVRFANLRREYVVQETLYTLLTQQRELGMIAEAQEPDVFNVIDYATAPDQPARPVKKQLVFSAFIASLILGMLMCWLLEWVRNPELLTSGAPSHPDPRLRSSV